MDDTRNSLVEAILSRSVHTIEGLKEDMKHIHRGKLGFVLHSCRLQYVECHIAVMDLDLHDGGYSDNGLRSENARALNNGCSALPVVILHVDLVGTVTCYVPILDNGASGTTIPLCAHLLPIVRDFYGVNSSKLSCLVGIEAGDIGTLSCKELNCGCQH
ncbi:hypothetical protein ARMGADRAFT_1038390 [Armillaria gallica]|uniref:Uncharacterized protein n=1 Tax=Armillaria gallica TaxID=47427 RepID=A0A2H3CI23_ARMGA|nr:hypothetical protein ARMGADRAFT_1038390 [Armillaria gallica]